MQAKQVCLHKMPSKLVETTKYLLQYFTAMGQKNRAGMKVKDADNIETRVLESTPVMEAFGNAKTLYVVGNCVANMRIGGTIIAVVLESLLKCNSIQMEL